MNKILTLLFLFLSIGAFAQTETPQVFGSRYYEFKNTVRVDSGFLLPRADTVFLRTSLKAPSDIRWRPADSLLYYYNGLMWVRLAKHSDVANGVTLPQLNDTLTRYLTFNTRLTPLASGANLPIQPTDSLTQALAKLQAQINAFIGQFMQLNPLTFEPGANPKITGKLNIKGNTGTTYPLMLERASNTTDDIAIGFKSGASGDTVFRAGLINRLGIDDFTFETKKGNIRNMFPDTAVADWVTYNRFANIAKIVSTMYRGKWMFGDSLNYKQQGQYPIHIVSAQDTSFFALHKIYTPSSIHAGSSIFGVTESLSDNSTKMASTAYVKGQNYLTPTSTADFILTGRAAITANINSQWAGIFTNNGTTGAHGLYVNVGSGSTGTIFRADKNGVSVLEIQNAGRVQITGTNGYAQFRLVTNYTPTSSADSNGLTGDIAKDDNFIYIKTSTGWKRAALSAW